MAIDGAQASTQKKRTLNMRSIEFFLEKQCYDHVGVKACLYKDNTYMKNKLFLGVKHNNIL